MEIIADLSANMT